MNPAQAPIPVENTATVTLSFDRYMTLKSVEMDKERYATQIHEAQNNVTRLEAELANSQANNPKVTELQNTLAEYQQAIIDKDAEIDRLNLLLSSSTAGAVVKQGKTASAKKVPTVAKKK